MSHSVFIYLCFESETIVSGFFYARPKTEPALHLAYGKKRLGTYLLRR
jgi:hypothetical protein